jgi:TIR domain
MAEADRQSAKLNVFISYSRDDLGFADQLDAALGLAGFGASIDRQGISGGEEWEKRLGALIRDADTVVFVLSPSSARSKTCTWEVEQAVRLGKRIIPVLCCSLEGATPPPQLAELNYIFFYAEPRFPGSGFGSGLVRLASALNTDLDWLREHTRYLQRETEWDQGGRPANRLLSGPDVPSARAWAARRPKNAPEPTELQLDFIKASEAEETRRQSDEAQRLREMADAQAAREAALAEREKAQAREAEARKSEAEAQKREAEQAKRVARRTLAGLVAAVILALVAGSSAIYAVNESDQAKVQESLALKATQTATEQRDLERFPAG